MNSQYFIQQLTLGSDISYSDLKFGEQIGRGAFGEVYKATYRGNLVAVKKLFVAQGLSQSEEIQKFFESFRKELEIISSLNHPNIVKCLGGCIQPPNLCIVTVAVLFTICFTREESCCQQYNRLHLHWELQKEWNIFTLENQRLFIVTSNHIIFW
jgi:serine/threonine protein kinase